jgi:hypothetical protein
MSIEEIEVWLLENEYNDVVTNASEFPANTKENAQKWIYVSDILEHFQKENHE